MRNSSDFFLDFKENHIECYKESDPDVLTLDPDFSYIFYFLGPGSICPNPQP